MTSFRFEFNGNVQPNTNPVMVKRELAKKFSVPESELDELMQGNAQFIREPLDGTTARLYQRTFEQLGALCNISRLETQPKDTSQTSESLPKATLRNSHSPITPHTDTSSCPKCKAQQTIKDDQCTRCGIYIEKYLARNSNTQEALSTEGSDEEFESRTQRKEAVRWVSLSVTGMLGVSIADGYMSQLIAQSSLGFDIGPIPYIIAYLFLCFGCILYADAKGYSFKVGLLGLFSFAGLSILLLLSDKKSPSKTRSFPQILFAILSITYSAYWAQNQFVSSQKKEAIFSEASSLSNGRENFPSVTLQSGNEVYEQELNELTKFIEDSLKILQESEYRTTKAIHITNEIMRAIVDFSYWLNYQTYLHHINSKKAPESVSNRAIHRHSSAIKQSFSKYLSEMPKTGPITQTIRDWYIGKEDIYANPTKPQKQLMGAIQDIQQKLRQEREKILSENEGIEKPTLNLDELILENTSHIRLSTDKTSITIEVIIKPGKIKKIILGVYLSGNEQAIRKTYYHINLTVLSSEIDNIYLKGQLNAISSWEIPGVDYF